MEKQERLQKYFERIGLDMPEDPRPTADLLAQIVFAQQKSIPYSNIDNINRVVTPIDYDSLIDRLVVKKMGGICIDLNGLLKFVLEDLGYVVKNVFFRGGVNLRHRFLIVTDVEGTVWHVDSGAIFDNITAPMKMESGLVQKMHFASYKLEKEGDLWAWYEIKGNDCRLIVKYSDEGYPDEYYYQIKQEDVHLDIDVYKAYNIGIYTDTGRKTLFGDKYRESSNGEIILSKNIETEEHEKWALSIFGLSK